MSQPHIHHHSNHHKSHRHNNNNNINTHKTHHNNRGISTSTIKKPYVGEDQDHYSLASIIIIIIIPSFLSSTTKKKITTRQPKFCTTLGILGIVCLINILLILTSSSSSSAAASCVYHRHHGRPKTTITTNRRFTPISRTSKTSLFPRISVSTVGRCCDRTLSSSSSLLALISSSSSYLASLSSSSTPPPLPFTATTRPTVAAAITPVHPPTSKQRDHTHNNNMSSTTTPDVVLYKPMVVCGPSGVGKGTLIEMIMKYFDQGQFGFSVSHTTRSPRDGEIEGKHYYFTTVPKMKEDIAASKFIEYAEVHGRYYGTSFHAVETVQKNGQICILDIDVQGVQKVKASSLDVYYIFIAPPSYEELEKRLRGRATETEEAITTRLGNAKAELQYGETPGNFDRVFINNDLVTCFEEIKQQLFTWYPHLLQYKKE